MTNFAGYLSNRIARLQATEDRRAADVNDPEHYNFRVAVSCPPDLRLHMRGGLMYVYRDDGNGWFVDPTTVDLTDPVQMLTKTYTFTNADYYLGYILRLGGGGRYPPLTFYMSGTDIECATAAEAEQSLLDYAYDTDYTWYFNYPLCGVVLRNNGTLGTGYNILPIDRINRGRSYIWPADMRPRNIGM